MKYILLLGYILLLAATGFKWQGIKGNNIPNLAMT
jgi:hypothetical protein